MKDVFCAEFDLGSFMCRNFLKSLSRFLTWSICVRTERFTVIDWLLLQKLSGNDLKYTALIGKPSPITYHHAEYCLNEHAKTLGIGTPVQHLYCVGYVHTPSLYYCGTTAITRPLVTRRVTTNPVLATLICTSSSSHAPTTSLCIYSIWSGVGHMVKIC